MRGTLCVLTLLSAIGFSFATPLRGEQMPQITGQSLSGKQIAFPSVSAGLVAIVFVGFSHASQSQLKPWVGRETNEFRENRGVAVYSIAVLEDAPRLVRGMAVHGMKSEVPAQQQDRFVVVYQRESELKRVCGFRRAEEAYILLLNRKGEIQWVSHGPLSDAAAQELRNRIDSVLRTE